jgi:hypothetical protein
VDAGAKSTDVMTLVWSSSTFLVGVHIRPPKDGGRGAPRQCHDTRHTTRVTRPPSRHDSRLTGSAHRTCVTAYADRDQRAPTSVWHASRTHSAIRIPRHAMHCCCRALSTAFAHLTLLGRSTLSTWAAARPSASWHCRSRATCPMPGLRRRRHRNAECASRRRRLELSVIRPSRSSR